MVICRSDERDEPHTADLVFFKITANPDNPPDAKVLRKLLTTDVKSFGGSLNLLDGNEHDYFAVGRWLDDPAAALTLMGLGAILNLWTLHTPTNLHPGVTFPRPTELSLAECGCISIVYPTKQQRQAAA